MAGSPFDTDIFEHPFRLSRNAKITDNSETKNINQNISSVSHIKYPNQRIVK